MRKTVVLMILLLAAAAFAETTLDLNITYEGSVMKVKETVCGFTPALEKGYAADEDGCYYTEYRLDQPMYGYEFEPKTKPDGPYRAAYYIAFYDSVIPDGKKLHADVMQDGSKINTIDGIYHDRILQGAVLLDKGQYVRLTSDKEQPYYLIYIITVIIVLIGLFFIVRRKK